MAGGSGGTMDIVILIALAGGFIFLWPQISSMLTPPSAVVGATDTAGDAEASDKGGSVTAGQGGAAADGDAIRRRTKRMIAEITARARRRTRSGGGTNISVQGSGATACANGRCTSSYGEMRMGISNIL